MNLFSNVDTSNIGGVAQLLSNAITIAAMIAGAVSVIFLIVGGIQYITSGGGDGVKRAKTTIVYAVVGLALSVVAFGLVNFVIGSLTGKSNAPVGVDCHDPKNAKNDLCKEK